MPTEASMMKVVSNEFRIHCRFQETFYLDSSGFTFHMVQAQSSILPRSVEPQFFRLLQQVSVQPRFYHRSNFMKVSLSQLHRMTLIPNQWQSVGVQGPGPLSKWHKTATSPAVYQIGNFLFHFITIYFFWVYVAFILTPSISRWLDI